MQVLKVVPRGYCYGVVDALVLAKRIARDPGTPRPIHVLGQIVHNRHAVEELNRHGIVTLDGPDRLALLDTVTGGTVIFTAHGISPRVKERARARGLHVVDATCPDVERTHDLIRSLAAGGARILYIGKRGHPEPEGAMGEAPGRVHLVETRADVDALGPLPGRLAVLTQTTLSQWDTRDLIAYIQERYPEIEVYNEICRATQERQEAAVAAAREVDCVVVVGDTRSNNSNRLVEVVRKVAGRPSYLVDSVAELDPAWFRGLSRVAVTAGSSTPTEVTRAVIERLESL